MLKRGFMQNLSLNQDEKLNSLVDEAHFRIVMARYSHKRKR